MKIGYVTADWSDIEDPDTGFPTFGGAGWYRVGMPCKYLPKRGVEAVAVEKISTGQDGRIWLHDWAGETHKDVDLIVFQRWMDENAADVIYAARGAGQIVLNDVDDWYWGLDRRNDAYKATDPKVNPTCNRDHYWRALEASDGVTVSTPFLRDQLSKLPCEVRLVRNAIDVDRFGGQPSIHVYNIGWVGSTAHRSGDLEILRGIAGPFVERNYLSFVHAGYTRRAPSAGDLAGVPEDRQVKHQMVPITEYPDLISTIDIGVVPLNDVPFNHAKSAVKGMEYAAAGIPFVATRSPEYDWLSNEVGVGLTAKKPREWVKHLDSLMDLDFRFEQIEKNRARIYDLDVNLKIDEWVSAYEHFLA